MNDLSDVCRRRVGELRLCIVGHAYRSRGRDTVWHHRQHTEHQKTTFHSM